MRRHLPRQNDCSLESWKTRTRSKPVAPPSAQLLFEEDCYVTRTSTPVRSPCQSSLPLSDLISSDRVPETLSNRNFCGNIPLGGT